METALKQRGFDSDQLNITMELESTHAIKQVVAAGLGITILSSLTVSKESERNIFKTLKIQDTPLCQPFSILSNASVPMIKEEKDLINLFHNHQLIEEILSEDYYELGRKGSVCVHSLEPQRSVPR